MDPWSTHHLDLIPRLGWVTEPTPVTEHAAIARRLGLGGLWIKRDDRLAVLCGGTKPRKLDYLLAAKPFAAADGWHAAGSIGSGHLVALAQAAKQLGRQLHAHAFWVPPSPQILDNLAFVASHTEHLCFYEGRVRMALRRPQLFSSAYRGRPVIPPGASTPDATLGMVRAGLELGEQIREGLLPRPERIYVALGSGGTAAGLVVGLSLAQVETSLHAVATVERSLSSASRLRDLIHATWRALHHHLPRLEPHPTQLIPWRIDRQSLGRGYAHESDAGEAAMTLLLTEDVQLEGVYTAKAMASLQRDAKRERLGPCLFWHTAHRGPLPHDDNWQTRLPAALARRLARPSGSSRRRLLLAGGAAAALGLVGIGRVTGYAPWPQWQGAVLAAWEAQVLRAAAEAFLPHATREQLDLLPMGVDHFLCTMPKGLILEIHGLIALVEHGTTPLGLRLSRLTELPPPERAEFFSRLEGHRGLLAQAARGLRDLCLMGFYRQPSTWAALGYEGPWVKRSDDPSADPRPEWPTYEALKASRGVMPKGVVS